MIVTWIKSHEIVPITVTSDIKCLQHEWHLLHMMPMMFRYIHVVFVVRPCQRFFRVMPPLQMSCTYLSLFPETKQDRGVLIIISNNSSYVLFIACENCLFHQIMRKNSTRKFFGQFVRTPWIRCVYITSKYHPLFHPWPLTYIWPWISNMTLTFFIVTSISIYLLIKSVLGVWCSTFCVFKVYKYMYKSTVKF